MRNAADRKHVLQLSRQGCIRIRRITVVLLGFLSGLRTKESGIVGVLAMHQRDETQVTELLLATIRDGHFGGALQCQLSVIGLEGMRGQVFDQTTALDPTNGGTPAVCFESGCQACTQCVGRVHPQVLAVIGAIDVLNEVEALGGHAFLGVIGQTAQEPWDRQSDVACVLRFTEGLPLCIVHRIKHFGQITGLAEVGKGLQAKQFAGGCRNERCMCGCSHMRHLLDEVHVLGTTTDLEVSNQCAEWRSPKSTELFFVHLLKQR